MATRPKIVTSLYQVPEMADKVRAAIEDINQPRRIFGRAEDMVRVVGGGDGRLLVRTFDAGAVKAEAEKAVIWRKPRQGGDVPSRVPSEVVDFLVHDEPIWPELPFLRRMVHAPVILPDARILSLSGYDPDTQLFLALDPSFVLPPIPDEPTEDDLMRSASYVQSYLDEFVFAEMADAANALGMFIGHLLRPLLGEEALLPMFDIDAPTQATGKTALANATGMLALGSAPKLIPEIKDADEMRKQITSMLVGENELMLFDNLTQKLDDASLAAALTGEGMWGGRLLGTNNLANARANTTFIATGNNLEIGPDLRRRSIYIRLDANMADPSQRRFRRADFLGMLKSARPTLLAALFTWIRRWLQLGSPSSGAPIMVGYNPFVRAVHGLLKLVGREQWLGNLQSFRQNQDPETAVWGHWLAEWYRLWASEPVPSADLAKALNDQGNATYQAFSDLRPDDLATYTQIDREKLANTLGHVLGRQADRVFDEFKLTRATRADGIRRWRVVPVDRIQPEPPDPSSAVSADADAREVGTDLIVVQQPQNTEDVYTGNVSVSLVPKVSIDSQSRPALRKSLYARDTETIGTNGTNDTENQAARARARQAIAEGDLRGLKMVALDTETTGLKTWQGAYVRLVTLDSGDRSDLIDLKAPKRGQRKKLEAFLRDGTETIPMHNARFDLAMLTTADPPLPMPKLSRVFDTMLAAQLLDASAGVSGKYGLDDLAARYLDETLDKTLQTSDWSGDLTAEQDAYARQDAAVTRRLAFVLEREIAIAGMREVLRIETEFLAFMVELELHGGLPVDVVAWMAQQEQFEDARLVLEARLAELYTGTKPKRWSARTWLQNYIREQGYLTGLTSDGKPQISAPALEEYAHDPLIKTFLDWKKLETRSNGWGQEYLDANVSAIDNCFHGDYRQLGTRTGRLSCSKPNLQQIPRSGGLREAIHPKEGRCFIKADYSQLQLVIVADESGDVEMCKAYDPKLSREERRLPQYDLHTTTAKSVLREKIPTGEKVKGPKRVICKNINFGLCYGMGAARLAGIIERETGEPCDIELAKQQRYRYFETYSGVKHWHGLAKHRSSRGRTHEDEEFPNPIDIRTPAGRRRSNVVDFTQKVNSPIQMREADGVKSGLALLPERLTPFNDARPVMMIHDEVIVECDIAEAEEVKVVVETALEEGMNAWLKYTTATVEAEIVRNYAGDPL